eukprot:2538726-Amphidinium_carterae.1
MEVGAVHPDKLESHVTMFHGRPVADEAIELVLPEGEFEFWDDVHGGWLPKEAVLADWSWSTCASTGSTRF